MARQQPLDATATVIFTATGSFSSTKVLMPRLRQSLQMLLDQILDSIEFMVRKASILGKSNWVEPELCNCQSRLTWICTGSPLSELKNTKLYVPSRSTVGIFASNSRNGFNFLAQRYPHIPHALRWSQLSYLIVENTPRPHQRVALDLFHSRPMRKLFSRRPKLRPVCRVP